jgi:uncharacterized protein involved in exopolysaccharide biosynthesis/Mrp family chromosome partitioning ATPase
MNDMSLSGHPTPAAASAGAGALTVYTSGYALARHPSQMMGVADPALFSGEREATISLVDIIGYLKKRWKFGVLVGIPMAAVVFALLGMGERVFESESRVLLRMQDSNIFNFGESARSGVTELSAPMLVNNHRSELKSRRFVDYLYDHMKPADRDAFIKAAMTPPSLTDGLKRLLGLLPPETPPNMKEIFALKMDTAARVDVLKESHVLRVQIRDTEPKRSADIANQYVEQYIRYVADEDLSFSKTTSAFLDQKAADLLVRLQESERRLAEYRQKEDIVQDSQSNDAEGEKVRLINAALADAEVKLAKARRDSETISEARRTGRDLLDVRLVADNADVIATRRALDAAISSRSPLSPFLGPKHPKMIAVKNQIDTLQSELERDIQAVVTMVETEEKNLTRQVADIQQQLDIARGHVTSKGGVTVQMKLLADQVALDRDLYQKIITRRNQANLTGEFRDTAALRISDIAVVPVKPVKPNKPLALLAAIAFFALAFAGVPVGMGLFEDHVLPSIKASGEEKSEEPAHNPAEPAMLPAPGALAAAAPKNRHQPDIVASLPELYAGSPPLMLAELLRKGPGGSASMLQGLTSLLEQQRATRPGPRIVLITSAASGEGKSMISSALAASFCARGRRVFMMECNPGAPSFSDWFPQCHTQASFDSDMEVLRYGSSNLFLLPANDLPSYEVSDLLDSYRAWLSKALPVVDWIILDGASLLRDFADVAPLVPLATDILFVNDASRATESKVKAALSLLKPMMSVDVLRGVVMNRERI